MISVSTVFSVSFNNVFNVVVATLLILTAVLTVSGMIRFSSILIKLVALEVLSNLLMACIALWALITHQRVFIDICLTLALIMFLGVVAYYQFLFNGKDHDHHQ